MYFYVCACACMHTSSPSAVAQGCLQLSFNPVHRAWTHFVRLQSWLCSPNTQKSQTADGDTVAKATMASDGLNLAVLFRNIPVNRTTGTMKTAGSERVGRGITEVLKGALQGPCTAKWANI